MTQDEIIALNLSEIEKANERIKMLEDKLFAIKQAIAELESQEPMERDWRKAPWGFGEKRLSTVEYSDIVSDGGLDPRNKFDTQPQLTEQNFCSRCGKRTKDLTHIHTCTPPQD